MARNSEILDHSVPKSVISKTHSLYGLGFLLMKLLSMPILSWVFVDICWFSKLTGKLWSSL